MNDDALAIAVEKHNVFARINPLQKHRIIMQLKHNGHVVGYMGDGINDAPSLKAADVSISVANAVDIAKQSADIILMQQDLQVLQDGIIEGRKTFGNTMKYILMCLSSNFGNMISASVSSIFLPFLPMLPIQLLLKISSTIYHRQPCQLTMSMKNISRHQRKWMSDLSDHLWCHLD